MTIRLETRQALALRKSAATMLRKHKLGDLENCTLHAMTWRELNDLEADTKRESRAMMDRFQEVAQDETRLKEFEDAHDGLMGMLDGIAHEKDARSQVGDKGPRSSPHHPMAPIPADGSAYAIDDGQGPYRRNADAEEVTTLLRPEQRMADWLLQTRRSEEGEYRGLTTGEYLRAMIAGPRNGLEKRALAEGSDSAGGYTVPTILSARLIDRMRAASTVIRAGATTVPLTSETHVIAKLLTDPVPAWRDENAAIDESDPTFGRVQLVPKSLGVIVRVSRELLEDSVNVGTALPNIIATAMAAELDRVALLGSGVAPEPKGVVNFTGLTANTFTGGTMVGYQELLKARAALMSVNASPTAYIMSSRDENYLAAALDGEGRPLVVPPVLANVPMFATTKIPTNGGVGTNESNIFAGEWSKLLIGIRHEIRIEILKERYATEHQYGFVAVMRADVAAEHEGAFTVLEGVTV